MRFQKKKKEKKRITNTVHFGFIFMCHVKLDKYETLLTISRYIFRLKNRFIRTQNTDQLG